MAHDGAWPHGVVGFYHGLNDSSVDQRPLIRPRIDREREIYLLLAAPQFFDCQGQSVSLHLLLGWREYCIWSAISISLGDVKGALLWVILILVCCHCESIERLCEVCGVLLWIVVEGCDEVGE